MARIASRSGGRGFQYWSRIVRSTACPMPASGMPRSRRAAGAPSERFNANSPAAACATPNARPIRRIASGAASAL